MEKLDVLKEAVGVLTDLGFRAELYEDYSGRGMYGATTLAIVTDALGTQVGPAIITAIGLIAKRNGEDIADWLTRASQFNLNRSDNMGLYFIYY